jgi:hypothetical protein
MKTNTQILAEFNANLNTGEEQGAVLVMLELLLEIRALCLTLNKLQHDEKDIV